MCLLNYTRATSVLSARESVWWPGLSQQVNDMVLKCRACIQERRNTKEPLKPTECPQRPWQKLRTDLFTLESKTYLLVTDAITHLKSIFARHGIPEVLMSDNGPQFSGQAFTSFVASYGFKHGHTSPERLQTSSTPYRLASPYDCAVSSLAAGPCTARQHQFFSEGKGEGDACALAQASPC
ncbi:hypothetical protein N1851_028577 [Merluccius polli]|uniref:Integrase catalytic domain-containing protein n=1 Tax=Merluccius polli TaxID=89951 RepID=A0AA47M8P9_MERPO|nr:hypothetical protein N1851_028577 [Merluccius polli]